MATKLQLITELSEKTAHSITGNSTNWTSFLKTAAWSYKYPFHDQLLIFAQRPKATACAPIEIWNEKLGRWVNRGAKGIALIDDSGNRLSLRHVFDISDTNSRYGRPVNIWAMKEEYEDHVTETLENAFGELKDKDNIPTALVLTAFNAVEDNCSDYLSDLMHSRDNSLLKKLDDLKIEFTFKEVLMSSVSYMLLVRCGYSAVKFINPNDFQGIVNFNTLDSISILGTAVRDISEMVLKEIGATVKDLQRKERKLNRTFEKKPEMSHNEGENIKNKGDDKHGGDLQQTGGLSDTRSDTTGGKNAYRQVWDDEKNIFEKSQERDVRQPGAIRKPEPTSVGDRPDSEGADRADHDETAQREPGSRQSSQSGFMDRTYEQFETVGRGNSDDRTGVQLTIFQTIEQQMEAIQQAEDEKSSAFSISQEEIDYVLCKGTGVENGKFRVYQHYQEQHTSKENVAFLKNEYGIGGRTHYFLDGTSGSESHDGKGITIIKGEISKPEIRIFLSWGKVQKRLGELIVTGRYLSSKANKPAQKEILIGMKLSIQDRKYIIDSINTEKETVSLKDITFQSSTGFPIFRSESLEFVRNILDMSDSKSGKEPDNEPEQKKTKSDASPRDTDDLVPKAQKQTRINFQITDNNLGTGGPKTKYDWNISAIRLVNQLEEENRLATPEEQEILCRYVGWGGIPQVFDEQNSQWAKEYVELKEVLNPEEYASARASTLNAHFTSPTIINSMYACLANMGFKTGNILEPACGVGNFLGLIPDSMKNSKLYGIELDSITGRIAKQLYQNASISVQGFEQSSLPDSFFDLAIGNVPFGSYGVSDKKYDKYKFYIHDYFFAKTLDKVRPGGIIAFITSKGTMDKQNPGVRKYIAQRSELLGAVRLPNNAFYANAGTDVTADILFLQKRDRMIDFMPRQADGQTAEQKNSNDWIHLSTTENGIPINSYFAKNPDMVLGTMVYDDRLYRNNRDTTCVPYENSDLSDLLREALENIHAEITEFEPDDPIEDIDNSIPADPSVRNFSFTIVDGSIYYRENSRMNKVDVSVTAANRIKGMIAIRNCVRELIEYQTEDYSDEVIKEQQQKLNRLYDGYIEKYGLLNNRGNSRAFADDSSYSLLCSLEILDDNGDLDRKADMFTKRTIRQRTTISQVDTASEALAISIGEKACVDMGFMQSLTGLSEEQIIKDLQGVIFRNPINANNDGIVRYETADEYLSGNVREKLKTAREFAEMHPDIYSVNVSALEAVQPKDLDASEIDVRLGATWIPADVIKDFMFEILETPYLYRRYIDVLYSSYTANWNIKGKSDDRSDNIKANVTYGTKRINGYKIIEESLNLRDVRIFDTVIEDGLEKRILNKKETAIAQQKQEAIKEEFQSWIWKDPSRRERLTRLYNDRFNAIRPREYDGSHIRFTGMNPEITLRKHQVDAVAHILYGGNALLAHCVGAGKTYAMAAAAIESKHLGLCQKSMFVVPNHLTEQWAAEFLQLYPSANILVATRKDFETKNRKKFCARIATGDYDAVIIGHSQFEKIPISAERQKQQLEEQITEITEGIRELKEQRGERYAIKQMEKTKKTLKLKLDRLNDTSRKDDVVTFEELGVDRLFVDEADFYKNLFLYTKMRNVAGLSQTEAQKSSDLFTKCRYLDKLTNGRGIIFATGTPISNSITEMYTMQRYLQYETLCKNSLQHFDCWASTFGETVTAIELAPEGTGYRAKTRFARFYNLPELMNMFKEVADIQTADMLSLPVPKANYNNVAVKPSDFQKDMVAELAERAERVRAKLVEPHQDNMLKITNDGRKLALDQRLANSMLPDNESSKVNACVQNVYRLWNEYKDQKLTQLVFCDLSTPKNDGSFNVYEDVQQKLIQLSVPAEEIAFIHNANTEVRKKELFAKVRKGQVRILLGSTFRMGAGTNVQDKLIALHDLDCPWRPRDLEQRSGRIVRQGNRNDEVHIFRYVTENTFDAYLYQIIENKQRFISQIMTSKSPVRSAEDIDETALSYAEVKALATGNPYIREKMNLDIEVSKLKLLKANHLSQRYALEDRLYKHFPQQIESSEERISGYEKDIAQYERYRVKGDSDNGVNDSEENKFPGMTIKGTHYAEKAKAGEAILEACKLMRSAEPQELGNYMGFPMFFSFDSFNKQYQVTLRGALRHTISLGTDIHGNITRINNVLSEMPKKLEYCREQLNTIRSQMETARKQIDNPFEKEQELSTKSARLAELNILLNMDKRENEVIDSEPDDGLEQPKKKAAGYER